MHLPQRGSGSGEVSRSSLHETLLHDTLVDVSAALVQSLGVSAELKEAGYALMCVGYPRSDLVLETVEEDEVYDLQFGRSFAEQAVDPSNSESIERDDWALEIANMDE